MNSTTEEKVPLTRYVLEGSEPLASALFAVEGTIAARVLEHVEKIITGQRKFALLSGKEFPKRLDVTTHIVKKAEDAGDGLFLVESWGSTYSTRYSVDKETGQKRMKIGQKLPEQRIAQAANEIVAMLLRGVCTWIVTNKVTGATSESQSAYGVVPRKRVTRSDWRERQQRLSDTRRALFMHEV